MSYETKPMKMQWQSIDGRQVPFVLPQYWDSEKNDWVVTSEVDRLPVDARVTGSRVEELLLLDAVSVEGKNSILVSVPRDDCTEMWFALAIDQFPSRMAFRPYFTTSLRGESFYPQTDLINETYATSSPLIALYHRLGVTQEENFPENIIEAKEIIMPYNYGESLVGRIYNDSNEICTITLKILKIWR